MNLWESNAYDKELDTHMLFDASKNTWRDIE